MMGTVIRLNRKCKICFTIEDNTIQWHKDKWCNAGGWLCHSCYNCISYTDRTLKC
jgi:hypothetical protein